MFDGNTNHIFKSLVVFKIRTRKINYELSKNKKNFERNLEFHGWIFVFLVFILTTSKKAAADVNLYKFDTAKKKYIDNIIIARRRVHGIFLPRCRFCTCCSWLFSYSTLKISKVYRHIFFYMHLKFIIII